MIRKAFRMSVNEGQESEYERRHNPIWQELTDALTTHGVTSYSIFIDPITRDLFAYAEIESEERWKAIAEYRCLPPMVGAHARDHAVERG